MSRRTGALTLLFACTLLWLAFSAEAKKDYFPHMPGAILLTGWPGWELAVTTPSNTWMLQAHECALNTMPSMSRDGKLVAVARPKGTFPGCGPIAIAIYSISGNRWKEYKELRYAGASLDISPDGSRLVYAEWDEGPGSPVRLHFIDLKTGLKSIGPAIGSYALVQFSWSPDGRQIAFGMDDSYTPPDVGPTVKPTMQIVDLKTEKVTKIADGVAPAWSPSGEWIAYLDNSEDWVTRTGWDGHDRWSKFLGTNRISMVRPDGTGFKVLVTVGMSRFLGILFPLPRNFNLAPVWSPDSTKLLLNESADWEKGTFDIQMLGLSTLKMRKRFRDAPPVLGWAQAK